MRFSSISRLLVVFCWLPLVLCATKREAYIRILNNTPDTITGASISHKYSNEYKNEGDFSDILPGAMSREVHKVEYNTGTLTLGRDWWFITYHRKQAGSEGPNKLLMWYSDPTNFRNVVTCRPSLHVLYSPPAETGR